MSPQSSPPSPNPEYDFILKDQPKPKRSFSLPTGGSKMAFMIMGAVLALFILIIILASVLRPKAGGAQQLVNISAQAQEVVRVSKVVEPLAKNPDIQGLLATTEIALGSDQSQLAAYLKKAGVKTNAKTSTFTDKKTDAQMQTAAQNNSLDSAYAAYLKKSLGSYQASLKAAFPSVSKNAKIILNAAYTSTATILSAPQLASAPGS